MGSLQLVHESSRVSIVRLDLDVFVRGLVISLFMSGCIGFEFYVVLDLILLIMKWRRYTCLFVLSLIIFLLNTLFHWIYIFTSLYLPFTIILSNLPSFLFSYIFILNLFIICSLYYPTCPHPTATILKILITWQTIIISFSSLYFLSLIIYFIIINIFLFIPSNIILGVCIWIFLFLYWLLFCVQLRRGWVWKLLGLSFLMGFRSFVKAG